MKKENIIGGMQIKKHLDYILMSIHISVFENDVMIWGIEETCKSIAIKIQR